MDGLTVSFTTLIITIFISLLVACIVKLMTILLGKWAQYWPGPATDAINEEHLGSMNDDESDIAAVIAIAQFQNKIQ